MKCKCLIKNVSYDYYVQEFRLTTKRNRLDLHSELTDLHNDAVRICGLHTEMESGSTLNGVFIFIAVRHHKYRY